MAETLKQWLSERLKENIKWDPDEFISATRDGFVVASLLQSYNVISDDDLCLITKSRNNKLLRNNWRQITVWLKKIDLHLTDGDLDCIIEGKGSLILRLFYHLFLYLDKKDRITYIKKEQIQMSPLIEKTEHRFTVNAVNEDEESAPKIEYLAKPLVNDDNFIKWQKMKAEEFKRIYDHVRSRYRMSLRDIEEGNIPDSQSAGKSSKSKKEIAVTFKHRFSSKRTNYTFEDLKKLNEEALQIDPNFCDCGWTQQFLDNLQIKLKNKEENQNLQRKMKNILVGSIMDQSIDEEERLMDRELAKKVMKLSQFEKQMCTVLLETKQQARSLMQNRVIAERAFATERESQFKEFMDNLHEQIEEHEVEVDLEEQRQKELHEVLYKEKMKKKWLKHYYMCKDTMLALTDYAVKYAQFKELIKGDDIPQHFITDWKALFYKFQPIFEILDDVENVLLDEDELENSPEIESIIHLEVDRQQMINENDFNNYHNKVRPWLPTDLIPNYDPFNEDAPIEHLGYRILGHIVYNILTAKYPLPPARQPAKLPNYSIAAILLAVPDKSIVGAMQILLNFKKVAVVSLEDAINYCLNEYKSDLVGLDEYNKAAEVNFDDISKAFLAAGDSTDATKSLEKFKEKQNPSSVQLPLPDNVKQTQTPKTIPEEDIVLSRPAELGRYAYEAFASGSVLTDYLLADIIVEYLKSLKKIKGFVLINYPETYHQAKILEEVLTGKDMPKDPCTTMTDKEYLERDIEKKKIQDPLEELRNSKLVVNPHKVLVEPPFQSYFTSYINLKFSPDLLEEPCIWDLTEENSTTLDRFYADQGCNYSLYYMRVDKEILSTICKYVIGDFQFPIKTCDELFGIEVLNNLDFPTGDDKRSRLKISKPENKDATKKKLKGGRSKNLIEESKDELQTQTPNIIEITPECTPEESVSEFAGSVDLVCKPGEPDWKYANSPQPQAFIANLASVWEASEKCYIEDLGNFFLAKRLIMYNLIPYTAYVREHMHKVTTKPCQKQDLVTNFQRQYNNFDEDWRKEMAAKMEWHCRIAELQAALYEVCDDRKRDAEAERQNIISNNWTAEEMNTLVNVFISAMQAEVNRSALTYQVLEDFYLTMLQKPPLMHRIYSKDLTKLGTDTESVGSSPKSKRPTEDKQIIKLRTIIQGAQRENAAADECNECYNTIIENNFKIATKFIKELRDSFMASIEKDQGEFDRGNNVLKSKKESTTDMEEEARLRENTAKALDEWSMAVLGEYNRLNLRLQLIMQKAYRDLESYSNHMSRLFSNITQSINERYDREIQSVDRLCQVLQLHVENEEKIQSTLKIEHDLFVIDSTLLQYLLPPTPPPEPIEEQEVIGEFKISQLARLRDQFKLVALEGLIIERAFIYILQDFAVYGKEDCIGQYIPQNWAKLEPNQVPKLVFKIFGDTVYVDWRDFLICCLNLRFPTLEEVLDLRIRFVQQDYKHKEVVPKEDFMNLTLWYENMYDMENPYAALRSNLIKLFLFELFECERDLFNYTAFLLAFCKDLDPKCGFAKAVGVVIGERIAYDTRACENVVQVLIAEKRERDLKSEAIRKSVRKGLFELINHVVGLSEGIYITECTGEEQQVKKGEGKKGKTEVKTKAASKKEVKPAPETLSECVHESLDVAFASMKSKSVSDDLGHEEEVSFYSPPNVIIYSVSERVLVNLLEICLPWHFKYVPVEQTTFYLKELNEVLAVLEKDTDSNEIYICKFLQTNFMVDLLSRVHKFSQVNVDRVVNDLVNESEGHSVELSPVT